MGLVAGLLVGRAVEPWVRIGIRDDLSLPALEHRPGHALVVHEPNLARSQPRGAVRVQLRGLGIVEEDRSSVGADLVDRRLQQCVERLLERAERGDSARQRHEKLQLAQLFCLLVRGRLVGEDLGHGFFSRSLRIASIVACRSLISPAASCRVA